MPWERLSGSKEFYDFKNSDPEISRALSEAYDGDIIRKACNYISSHKDYFGETILEVGCDCGIISCFLAKSFPDAEIVSIDRCAAAIKIAKDFAKKQGLIYKENPSVPMSFMTVHKSKGLEAENVIILNFNNALLGFPNKISDDPILELVLSTADTFLYGEERRLFYVALTRTCNEVFLITSQGRPSEFLQDFDEDQNTERIPVDYEESKSISCPACKTGKLIERIGPHSKFVGCTNYPACTFKVQDLSVLENPVYCKWCGGLMVKRNGQRGQFYGCSNYPTCTFTMEIK